MDNLRKSWLYYSKTSSHEHIYKLCENADKEHINHLLSEDRCDGLAEEDCETRRSSQNASYMRTFKKIAGQILLTALKVKE